MNYKLNQTVQFKTPSGKHLTGKITAIGTETRETQYHILIQQGFRTWWAYWVWHQDIDAQLPLKIAQ